jgi:hypothetical protein
MPLGVFLISRLRALVGVAVLGFVLAACGAAAPSSVAGTWSGTLVDSLAGPGTIQFTIDQSGGSTLTGTYTIKFPAAANPVTGTLAGTLSGATVNVVLTPANASACLETFSASVSGSNMSGTYSYNAGCGGIDQGTFTLQLQ